jgi:hypothetical protein
MPGLEEEILALNFWVVDSWPGWFVLRDWRAYSSKLAVMMECVARSLIS